MSHAVFAAVLGCLELNAKKKWLSPRLLRDAVCTGVCVAATKRRVDRMVKLLRFAADNDVGIPLECWHYISHHVLKSGSRDVLQALLTEWDMTVMHHDLVPIVASALNIACARADLYSIRKLLAFAEANLVPVDMLLPLGSSIRKNHVAAIRALCAYKHANLDTVKASGMCSTSEWGDWLFATGCREHPLEMAFSEKPAVLQALLEMPWMQAWVQKRARACLERAVCCSGLNSSTLKMFLYHEVVPDWSVHAKPALELAINLERKEAVGLLVPYPGVAAVINKHPLLRARLLRFTDDMSEVPGASDRLLAALERKRAETGQ